eukprot:CAMPEP_0167751258 /NCGR_PEP_ID=MMETSP0110_2-20121227/6463_1 /TAXON_ID=629695 /ORGANISM="Gymnochlora sp., Strain CCMP2014" /LENGTH=755 /DNA_ID=CAMNT_0007636703 /DNA_START=18 /DNA_END=2285 /DNA_ORIENTATION=+
MDISPAEAPRDPLTTILPKCVSGWTAKDVGVFVKKLGKGKVWKMYAKKCERVGVDGSTLADATEAHLVELGFRKIHANKVLKKLMARADSSEKESRSETQRKEGVPFYLPLTCEEGERMKLFGTHSELVNSCRSKIEQALQDLSVQKNQELSKMHKEFDAVMNKLSQERRRCKDLVTQRHNTYRKILEDALKVIKDKEDEAKKVEENLNKSMCITKWSQQKSRMDLIMSKSQDVLKAALPVLSTSPSLRIGCFPHTIRMPFFDLKSTRPCFKNESALALPEQSSKTEEVKEKRESKEDTKSISKAITDSFLLCGTSSCIPFNKWIALTKNDIGWIDCYFHHLHLMANSERKIKNALHGLENQKQRAQYTLEKEFKLLHARLDQEKDRLSLNVSSVASKLKSQLESALKKVKINMKKASNAGKTLQNEINVTDSLSASKRSGSISRIVSDAIFNQDLPTMKQTSEMKLEFTGSILDSFKRNNLCEVRCHPPTFDNGCVPSFRKLIAGVGFHNALEPLKEDAFSVLRGSLDTLPILSLKGCDFVKAIKFCGGLKEFIDMLGGWENVCGSNEAFRNACKAIWALNESPEALLKFIRGKGSPLIHKLPSSYFRTNVKMNSGGKCRHMFISRSHSNYGFYENPCAKSSRGWHNNPYNRNPYWHEDEPRERQEPCLTIRLKRKYEVCAIETIAGRKGGCSKLKVWYSENGGSTYHEISSAFCKLSEEGVFVGLLDDVKATHLKFNIPKKEYLKVEAYGREV